MVVLVLYEPRERRTQNDIIIPCIPLNLYLGNHCLIHLLEYGVSSPCLPRTRGPGGGGIGHDFRDDAREGREYFIHHELPVRQPDVTHHAL